ncbi:MAG: heparinase II/III family protein [Rhodoferax sp.]|nr:heparinase II/III family protein [Rhodoferax sp.]
MKRRVVVALPILAGLSSHWPVRAAQAERMADTRQALQAIIPANHPRLLIRANEVAGLRTFLQQDPRTSMLTGALKSLDVDATQPLPQEPSAILAKSNAATQAARADWRSAGGAAIDTQLLALRWMLHGAPTDLATGVRWMKTLLGWRMSSQRDFARNPEAFVQTFHALLFAYDWLYDGMTQVDRQTVQTALATRADTLYDFMRQRLTLDRPVVPAEGLSYPIRYLSTLGHAAIALWGHHPTAQEQLTWIVTFYLTHFPVWGGDDGGWSEGIEYQTSALSHHLRLLEDLANLGFGTPIERPFWRNTGYFLARFLPPYESSSFSDLPTMPKPTASRRLLMDKLARINRDGRLLTLGQRYGSSFPTGTSYYQYGAVDSIFHVWRVSLQPRLESADVDSLPRSWLFADIGWVSIQSGWDQLGDTIMLGFKSSPIGSVSHAYADQNAIVINAFRQAMAVSAGVRDWYGSPHYENWTRATHSKNAILINGQGQGTRDALATGRIVRFVSGRDVDFVTGDASPAYRHVARQVLRHVLFVDRRYFVMVDEMRSDQPSTHQWLLHAPAAMRIDHGTSAMDVRFGNAGLQARVLAPLPSKLRINQVDYATPPPQGPVKEIPAQWNVTVETTEPSTKHAFLSFLRPWQGTTPAHEPHLLPSTAGHALRLGSDTVLVSEEASNTVVTSTHELVGRAAYLTTSRLVMVEGVRLVSTMASLRVDTPLTVELETRAAPWNMQLAAHTEAVVSLTVPKRVTTVDGPVGTQWKMSGDGQAVQVQLPASTVATRVLIGF